MEPAIMNHLTQILNISQDSTEKKPVIEMEFFEDRNGAIFVDFWRVDMGWDKGISWADFLEIPYVHEYMFSMYQYIHYKHPYHAERSTVNIESVTMEKVLKSVRKFISYYLADRDTNEPDFVIYSNGLAEVNIENVNCAIKCPIVKKFIDVGNEAQANARLDGHICKVMDYKIKKVKDENNE